MRARTKSVPGIVIAIVALLGTTGCVAREISAAVVPDDAIAATVTAVPAAVSLPATTAPAPAVTAPGATTTTREMVVTPSTPSITVAAVGDMMFSSAPGRLVAAEGGKAPFTKVGSRLRAADVTVGNLETPLSRRGTPVPGKTYTFRGSPTAAEGLAYAGFDLIALGNNHARDYGGSALADTFSVLGRKSISFAGAGEDRAAAWKPAIIKRDGATIAFLSFSEITPTSFAATSSRSGTAWVGDFDKVRSAIRSANKKADYVVVSFHWGVERSNTPTSRQVSEGRAAIRDGADAVLSHHPHVIQGVEFYRGKLIAYSLGNFVFSPGSAAGRDSMILHATLTPKGVRQVSVEPVWIGYNGRPVPATGTDASRILRTVKRTSAARGTTVKVSDGVARLSP